MTYVVRERPLNLNDFVQVDPSDDDMVAIWMRTSGEVIFIRCEYGVWYVDDEFMPDELDRVRRTMSSFLSRGLSESVTVRIVINKALVGQCLWLVFQDPTGEPLRISRSAIATIVACSRRDAFKAKPSLQ